MTPSAGPGRRHLVLFALIYAVQGVVVGYLFNFNKPFLRASGLGVGEIGAVQSLALLPLALKFLVGPFSDRFRLFGLGHRLPYMVAGLLTQAVGLLGMAAVDPGGSIGRFAACAVLAVVGLSIYDTCCDGMVVDVTPPDGRARVQGVLWTSRFLSATLATLGFGVWLDRLGGPAHADRILVACAAFTLVPVGLALTLREPPRRARGDDGFAWSAATVMLRPWSLALLAFGGLYGASALGVESNLSLLYDHNGLGGGADLGRLGAGRNLGRACGAAVLPLAVAWLPRRLVLTAGVVGLAGAIAGQTWRVPGPGALALSLGFGLMLGWNDTLFAALAMEAAHPRLAASTFALFMAVSNLGVVGDAVFARGVDLSGGFRIPTFVAAGVTLACLPLVVPLGRPGPEADPAESPA